MVGAIANELLIPARLTLRTAQANGTVETAISTSFDENNQVAAASRLQKFLDGKAQPKIQWASFEQKQIQGAFVTRTNTILISEELKNGGSKLDRVVLEELGHWLEAELAQDSTGDEGDRFASALTSDADVVGNTADQRLLLIDGVVVFAELANGPVMDVSWWEMDGIQTLSIAFEADDIDPNTNVSLNHFSFESATYPVNTSVVGVNAIRVIPGALELELNPEANINLSASDLTLTYEDGSNGYNPLRYDSGAEVESFTINFSEFAGDASGGNAACCKNLGRWGNLL